MYWDAAALAQAQAAHAQAAQAAAAQQGTSPAAQAHYLQSLQARSLHAQHFAAAHAAHAAHVLHLQNAALLQSIRPGGAASSAPPGAVAAATAPSKAQPPPVPPVLLPAPPPPKSADSAYAKGYGKGLAKGFTHLPRSTVPAPAVPPPVLKLPPPLRVSLTAKQKEVRDGSFRVQREAWQKSSALVREALEKVNSSQSRIPELSKEMESAVEKARQAQVLRERANGAQASAQPQQQAWMRQVADQEFGSAASLGDRIAASAEQILEAVGQAAVRVSSAVDPLQALALTRSVDYAHKLEQARMQSKTAEQASQRSTPGANQSRHRIRQAHESKDAKALAAACQALKAVVQQAIAAAGAAQQAVVLAEEASKAIWKPAADVESGSTAAMPGPPRTPLPIDDFRDEIVRSIKERSVVSIQGETGCGKSTRVPQFIYYYCRGAAAYLRGGEGERSILCVQPTRIMAVSLARRVACEMGESAVGGLVGYRVHGKEAVDVKKTKIVFTTSDQLLEVLVENPFHIARFSHVLMDELHVRSVDTDVLLLLFKLMLQHKLADFRIIIMSATLQDEQLAGFAQNIGTTKAPPPTIQCGETCFGCETLYLDDLLLMSTSVGKTEPAPRIVDELRKKTGLALSVASVKNITSGIEALHEVCGQVSQHAGMLSKPSPETMLQLAGAELLGSGSEAKFWKANPELVPDSGMCTAARAYMQAQLLRDFDSVTLELLQMCGLPGETILVFLPGEGELARWLPVLRQLETQPVTQPSRPVGCKFKVLILDGSLAVQAQEQALQDPIDGVCNVVLVSGLVESSVTLPKARVVIDFCLRRARMQDQSGHAFDLRMCQWVSQATAAQRAGRTGRVLPGVCIRMVSQQFFDSVMPQYDIPEFEYAPLERAYLQVKQFALRVRARAPQLGFPRQVFEGALLPPSPERLDVAVATLAQLGALNCLCDQAAEISALGRLCLMLPLDIRQCRLVFFGCIFGCVVDAVVMAVAISSADIFETPDLSVLKENTKYVEAVVRSAESRRRFDRGALSEPVMLRNVVMEFVASLKEGDKTPLESGLHEKSTSFDKFADAHALHALQLRRLVHAVADVGKRVLSVMTASSSTGYGCHRLRMLLVRLGVSDVPAADAQVFSRGTLFCEDMLLLKVTLTAAFAPLVAHGIVRCVDYNSTVAGPPPPSTAERGKEYETEPGMPVAIKADAELAHVHAQMVQEHQTVGDPRHSFCLPHMGESVSRHSDAWAKSLKEVLTSGCAKFKELRVTGDHAYATFHPQRDKEDDVESEASVFDEQILLPETFAADLDEEDESLADSSESSGSESGEPAEPKDVTMEDAGKAPLPAEEAPADKEGAKDEEEAGPDTPMPDTRTTADQAKDADADLDTGHRAEVARGNGQLVRSKSQEKDKEKRKKKRGAKGKKKKHSRSRSHKKRTKSESSRSRSRKKGRSRSKDRKKKRRKGRSMSRDNMTKSFEEFLEAEEDTPEAELARMMHDQERMKRMQQKRLERFRAAQAKAVRVKQQAVEVIDSDDDDATKGAAKASDTGSQKALADVPANEKEDALMIDDVVDSSSEEEAKVAKASAELEKRKQDIARKAIGMLNLALESTTTAAPSAAPLEEESASQKDEKAGGEKSSPGELDRTAAPASIEDAASKNTERADADEFADFLDEIKETEQAAEKQSVQSIEAKQSPQPSAPVPDSLNSTSADAQRQDDDGLANLPVMELKRRLRAKGIEPPAEIQGSEKLVSYKLAALLRSSADQVQISPIADSSSMKTDADMMFASFLQEVTSAGDKGDNAATSGHEDKVADTARHSHGEEPAEQAGESKDAESKDAASGDDPFAAFMQEVNDLPATDTGLAASNAPSDDPFAAFMQEINDLPAKIDAAPGGNSQGSAAAHSAHADPMSGRANSTPPAPDGWDMSGSRPQSLRFDAHRHQWVVACPAPGTPDQEFSVTLGPIEACRRARRFCELKRNAVNELQDKQGREQQAEEQRNDLPSSSNDPNMPTQSNVQPCHGLDFHSMNILQHFFAGDRTLTSPSGFWPPSLSLATMHRPLHPFQLSWRICLDGQTKAPTQSWGDRVERDLRDLANHRNPTNVVVSNPSKSAIERMRKRLNTSHASEELAQLDARLQRLEQLQARLSVAVKAPSTPADSLATMQKALLQTATGIEAVKKQRTGFEDTTWMRRLERLAVFCGVQDHQAVSSATLQLNGLTVLPDDDGTHALPVLLLLAFLRPRSCGGRTRGGCSVLVDLDSLEVRAFTLFGHAQSTRWVLPLSSRRRITLHDLQRVNQLRRAISAAVELDTSTSTGNEATAATQAPIPLLENVEVMQLLGELVVELGKAKPSFDDLNSGTERISITQPEKPRSTARQFGDMWIELEEVGAAADESHFLPACIGKGLLGSGDTIEDNRQASDIFFSFDTSVEDIANQQTAEDEQLRRIAMEKEAAERKAAEAAAAMQAAAASTKKILPEFTLPRLIQERSESLKLMQTEAKQFLVDIKASVKQAEKCARTLEGLAQKLDLQAEVSEEAWTKALQSSNRDEAQKALQLATSSLQEVGKLAADVAQASEELSELQRLTRQRKDRVSEGCVDSPQVWVSVMKAMRVAQGKLGMHVTAATKALQEAEPLKRVSHQRADDTMKLINDRYRRWHDEEKILREEAGLRQSKQDLQRQAQAEIERQQAELQRQQQAMLQRQQEMLEQQWGRTPQGLSSSQAPLPLTPVPPLPPPEPAWR
eukprot:TRINITY_DN30835_c0_g1_i1.p1 TRINITY_DN30835_c0_g1~~TRINITY_DN30835_c0_g1_i1.p1  ORF type:complete len:2723 (-),score=607.76 TRINITY_DN30835_c0_g1_i1:101-8269(-)